MIDMRESITAKLCSFARAYHSNFERQKIFDDYLAYDLMGRSEYEEIGQLIENGFDLGKSPSYANFNGACVYPTLNRYISPIPLSRIAFAERELIRFATENGDCQYVICGAGMDTFAFRNTNPQIRVFEIDHPDTQQYKLSRVRQLEWNIPGNVRFVAVDFARDDMIQKLQDAGFDPTVPSYFSILGVTYYLTLPVFEQTIEKIGQLSGSGNQIVFDFPDETTFAPGSVERVRHLTEITAKLGEPMLHGFTPQEIREALFRHGFSVIIHEMPEAIQNHFFGNRKDAQYAFENIHFISPFTTILYLLLAIGISPNLLFIVVA